MALLRFIHAADLHLDSPLLGLEAHEGAPVDCLRGATRRACENLVQLAIAERVNFLVIAGDVYDRDWKDYSTGLFFRRQMVRLKDQGIPVYLITGNHDAASVISRKLRPPENVHEFSTRAAESKPVAGLPVMIHGRGFPNRAVPENLALEYPAAAPGMFNLGVLHTSLTGRPKHDTYAPCTPQHLLDMKYAYWALGHIHQPEIVAHDPYIVFAGNSQGRHVHEPGPRGCWLVSVSDALEVEAVNWHSLDVIRWDDLIVDLSGAAHESDALNRIRKKISDAVENAEGRLLATRITLEGRSPLHGSFCREAEKWRSEILAIAQDFGERSIWIEKIQPMTSPVYDLGELAQRDALTKTVLDSLDQAPSAMEKLPPEIEDALGLLPSDIREDLEQEWSGPKRTALFQDVRSIILDALGPNGGKSA